MVYRPMSKPLSVIEEYLGLTGGPARFTQNFRSSVLLGNARTEPYAYAYGAITLYGPAFQPASTSRMVSHSAQPRQQLQRTPHNPHSATPAGYHTK